MSSLVHVYDRHGFVVLKRCIPLEFIQALRQDVHSTYAADLGQCREVTETNLWRRFPSAKQILRVPQLISTAQALLRCDQLRLWQDQLIIKRPLQGTATEWHQDAPYWPMHEPTALTCWIPLDSVDEAGGSIRFVRASHLLKVRSQLFPIELSRLLAGTGHVGVGSTLDLVESVALNAGDCSFHGGLVVHGANPNRADHARLAYKIVYMVDGTAFRFQWHAATDGLKLRDGARIAGPDFPLLS